MYGGRTSFRPRPTRILWTVVVSIVFAVVTYISYRTEGTNWVTLVLSGMFVFSLAGIVETLTDYMTLEDDEIRFRSTFRTVRIPKQDIEKVEWAAGCGVSVLRKSGKWTEVPDLGHGSQGIANSIRAWLRS